MTELKRVQQYFGKIKQVEEAQNPAQRTMTVNTEAATRILKADLVSFSISRARRAILTILGRRQGFEEEAGGEAG